MDPINNPQEGCVPISSNCVIWQGPDIPCISLCRGDSVSAVIYKLATELCTLLDTFNISVYEISCFNLGNCGPVDFKDLVQLLIEKICILENLPVSTGNIDGTLTTVVSICSEFYTKNAEGDLVTSLPVVTYVSAIGNRVCELIGQISTINSTLATLDNRVSVLESTTPDSTDLPTVESVCIAPGTNSMDQLLEGLEEAFCELRTTTGLSTDIISAISAACSIGTSAKLYGTGTMNSIQGWYSTPFNLAQSFSNLWKTVCDMRSAITFIKNNCCATGADAIDLGMTATLDGDNVVIYFNGTIPDTMLDATGGSTVIITDSVGGGPISKPNVLIKQNHLSSNTPLIIPVTSTINTSAEIYVNIQGKFQEISTGSVYNVPLTDTIYSGECPVIGITFSYTTLDWSFTWNGAPASIVVQVLNGMGNVVQSMTLAVSTPSQYGQFTGLTQNSNYSVRLVIHGKPCTALPFTTLAYTCLIPSLQPTTFDYSDPTGTLTGSTIATWQVIYNSLNY